MTFYGSGFGTVRKKKVRTRMEKAMMTQTPRALNLRMSLLLGRHSFLGRWQKYMASSSLLGHQPIYR